MNKAAQSFQTEIQRKRARFWRIFAIVMMIIVVVVASSRFLPGSESFGSFRNLANQNSVDDLTKPHIAKIRIEGSILDGSSSLELIDLVAKDENVKAIIVEVDSPGGAVFGAEAIYKRLVEVKEDKKIVTLVRGLAASGGLIVAIASDHIVSSEVSLVGSIGVYFEWYEFGEMMDWIGVRQEKVASSEIKGEPDFVGPTSEVVRERMQRLVLLNNDWFKNLIKVRRGIEGAKLEKIATGDVFTGLESVDLGLVDELGGEKEAVAYLVSMGVEPDLPVISRDLQLDEGFLARLAGIASKSLLGSLGLKNDDLKEVVSQASTLGRRSGGNGIMALWDPTR